MSMTQASLKAVMTRSVVGDEVLLGPVTPSDRFDVVLSMGDVRKLLERIGELEQALVDCFDAAIPQAMPFPGTTSEKATYAAGMLATHLRGVVRLRSHLSRQTEAARASLASQMQWWDVPDDEAVFITPASGQQLFPLNSIRMSMEEMRYLASGASAEAEEGPTS